MARPRSRRSSVRAVFEGLVQEFAVSPTLHDELWAALWNRRYDDVDEPMWSVDSAYGGIVVFARTLDPQTSLIGLDTLSSFVVLRASGTPPPVGSRVRMLPDSADRWRFSDVRRLGLGIELRFEDTSPIADATWCQTLRDGVGRLAGLIEARRAQVAAQRGQLGALTEPPTVEAVWREKTAAIGERIAAATEFTAEEHRALSRARAKGARTGDEEEHRIVMARRQRFAERRDAELARFRENDWPSIYARVAAARRKYDQYREEVVKLEDALNRLRELEARAARAPELLDDLERAEFPVRALALDSTRLDDPVYAHELLLSIELLNAAISPRSVSGAAHFSAYRPPTAGPAVNPPRP